MGRVNLDWQAANSVNCCFWINSYTYDYLGDLLNGGDMMGTIGWSNSYNALGQLTEVTTNWLTPTTNGTLVSGMTYNALGKIVSDTLGNDIQESWEYDLDGRPFTYNTNPQIYTYAGNIPETGLNWAGTNLVSSGDSVNGNWAYTYDGFGRLATAQCPNCTGSYGNSTTPGYTYDRYGNRWQQNVTSGTGYSPQYSFNTDNEISTSGFTYDSIGNMTNDTSHKYFYDAESRLIQVDGTLGTCSTATACYTYDAFGRRNTATVGGLSTWRLFDLDSNVITYVAMSNDSYISSQTYVAGRRIAVQNGSTTAFPHTDWLGSTRVLSNLSGAAIQTAQNLPFGDGLTLTGTAFTSFYYTGMKNDSEDNTNYTLNRQQSPTQGRWMIPDPAGLAAVDPSNPQTWNRYAYVTNNPVSFTDPTGLGDPGGAPAGPWSSAPGGGSIGFYGGGFSCTVDGLACGGNGGLGFLGSNGTALLPSGLSVVTPIDGGGFAFPTVAADGSISYTFSFDATYKGVPLTNAGLAETLGLPTGSVLGWLMGPAPNNGGQPQKPLLTGVPTPPNPVLKYANCAARVGSQAKRNSAIVEVASAVGLGNGVLGCVGTGPLIFQCEGAMAAVEGLVTGVNWGAERKSIWDGETACMQGQ
jgi:RHS repeat-associated protein